MRRASRWPCPTCWPAPVPRPSRCAPMRRSPCASSTGLPPSPRSPWSPSGGCPESTRPRSRSTPRPRRPRARSAGRWPACPRSPSKRRWPASPVRASRPARPARTGFRMPAVPSRRLRSAVLRLDPLLAGQAAQALGLAAQPVESLGQGGKIQLCGGPLLLPGGLLGEQHPFPVAQCRRGLVVLGPGGRLLLAPGPRYLLVEITHVRSGTDALLDGGQARVDRLEPGDGLRQQPPIPHVGRVAARGPGPVPLLLPGVLQQLEHLLADPVQVGAQRGQHLRGGALALADEAEQD